MIAIFIIKVFIHFSYNKTSWNSIAPNNGAIFNYDPSIMLIFIQGVLLPKIILGTQKGLDELYCEHKLVSGIDKLKEERGRD